MKLAKNQANAKSTTQRLKFCYFKIFLLLYPRYDQKIIGDILKHLQKQVPLF